MTENEIGYVREIINEHLSINQKLENIEFSLDVIRKHKNEYSEREWIIEWTAVGVSHLGKLAMPSDVAFSAIERCMRDYKTELENRRGIMKIAKVVFSDEI